MKNKQKHLLQFDGIPVNPPFEDNTNRNITPHKLWLDFTHKHIEMLRDGGELSQISPTSFSSPSSKILNYFRKYDVKHLNLDCSKFYNVGSTFADYLIKKSQDNILTDVTEKSGQKSKIKINDKLFYLPSDLSGIAINIHKKVIFDFKAKLPVKYDYVTCHNILIKGTNPVLSKVKTSEHIYPVFHTNPQTWFSNKKQDFASMAKVMWTRSGYTKPFYDSGILGGTDLVYYVLVPSEEQGLSLSHNLNSSLFKYIFNTAKWSGFGNDKVFCSLPNILGLSKMDDEQMFNHFGLTQDEKTYVLNYQEVKIDKVKAKGGGKLKDAKRIRETAEVFTCDEHADRLVNQMDSKIFLSKDSKILESSAGNGQIVMAILRRMSNLGRNDWDHILKNQLYVCEYMKDNVEEMIKRISDFTKMDVHSLPHNIIWGDFLKITSRSMYAYEDWSKNRFIPTQLERITLI